MMKVKHCIVFVLLPLMACGPSTKEIMNSWKGQHISKVVRSWGPPKKVVSDAADDTIHIWSDRVFLPLTDTVLKTDATVYHKPYSSTVKSTSTYTPPLAIDGDKIRMFYVNSRGIVYSWRAQGFINDPNENVLLIGAFALVGVVYLVLAIAEYQSTSYGTLKRY